MENIYKVLIELKTLNMGINLPTTNENQKKQFEEIMNSIKGENNEIN